MSNTPEKVRSELLEYFGDTLASSPYLEDYVKIGVYLANWALFHPQLLALEQAMASELDGRICKAAGGKISLHEAPQHRALLIRDVEKGVISAQGVKVYFSRLLTKQLTEFERQKLFVHGPSGKADILLGNLKGKFNQELRNARPFKDVGAGEGHGEFSHRIQWYLVGTSGQLRSSVVGVYTDIANHRSKTKIGGSYQYLWMYLFDRDGTDGNATSVPFKASPISDFRGPSNVNGYLRSDYNFSYPVLRVILARRYAKRQALNPVTYAAKKQHISDKQLYANDDEKYHEILAEMSKDGLVIER